MKKTIKNRFLGLSIAITIIFSGFSNINPQFAFTVETGTHDISCYNVPPEQPEEEEVIIIAP